MKNIQQTPMNLDYQQPYQQTYNNIYKTIAEYELEKNMRQEIQQDKLREYDFIVQEANGLLFELHKYIGNSLTRDSSNIYLIYQGSSFKCTHKNSSEIEKELSSLLSREVEILEDTKNIFDKKINNPNKIYLPLFFIKSKIEPILIFDIYNTVKNSEYFFNLFTYTSYLNNRFEDVFHNVINDKNFINEFLNKFTINNNSEYIDEWITYFFKTLRRIKSNLVLIGSRDVSEEIFYNGIIKQIFGFDYCITITDDILENQSVGTIIKNKLFLHVNHIPENKENQKKLKDLLEGIIVNDTIEENGIQVPFLCQIIFTLDQPHPFVSDFLSYTKVFFIDTIENINQKTNKPDRISLLNSIATNLMPFSQQLASLDFDKIKNYGNQYKYVDIVQGEVLSQRITNHSTNITINDTVIFKEKDYKTDNELFRNWLNNPELMNLALSFNSQNPVLDPFDNSFETIIPTEERYKHTYVTGKTGSGKSELLKTLIFRDIKRDDCSVILLDIHGDLSKDVARMVKDKERLVFIDPTLEKEQTPTINLFHTEDKSEENIEQVSQMITAIINDINVGDSPSGTMIDLLENCIPLLVRTNNKDFYDLKRLLKDIPKVTGTKEKQEEIESKRNTIKSEINRFRKNEFEEEYFEDEFMDVNNSTRQSVRRRLNKMLKDSKFSNLTNGENTIDLAKEMNSSKNKVIIFHIPKSKMLNTYSYYIKFIIGLIQIIALKRADQKEKNRKHTHLYIDEFHNFITPTIEEILTESRKYKLFLTFAHQSVSQIKDANLRDVILDNTNVKIVGKNSNKTLDMMNKTLNTKLQDVSKLTVGEFNLQSGVNDIIKIKNTDKLLNWDGMLPDEQWEEYKQYQLGNYYRDTVKKENAQGSSLHVMIMEFKNAILERNLSENSCLKKIENNEPDIFKEIEEDFGYIKAGIEQPRIRQQELSTIFKFAFNQPDEIKNTDFIKMLKDDEDIFDNETVSQTRSKKFDKDDKVKTTKYYLIPIF